MEEQSLEILQSNSKMLQEVIRQLEKDFHLAGVPLETQGKQSFQEFVAFLEGTLNRLLNEDSSLLMNLLYRVDISQKKWLIAFENGQLSELILKRELQKVALRRRFGTDSNGFSELVSG